MLVFDIQHHYFAYYPDFNEHWWFFWHSVCHLQSFFHKGTEHWVIEADTTQSGSTQLQGVNKPQYTLVYSGSDQNQVCLYFLFITSSHDWTFIHFRYWSCLLIDVFASSIYAHPLPTCTSFKKIAFHFFFCQEHISY